MDDNDPGETSEFVSGFSRTQPREVRERPRPATRPRQQAPPPRPAPPQADADVDFFEAGVREARARSERAGMRPPNPDPQPALRAAVPTQRKMSAPPPQRDDAHNYYDSGPMPRHDSGPMPRHDSGPMPHHDSRPPMRQESGPLPRQESRPLTRPRGSGERYTPPARLETMPRNTTPRHTAPRRDGYMSRRGETAPRHTPPPLPRHNPHPPPEDQYDTFRQRYNPGDLISSGRGRPAPHPDGRRRDDDTGGVNPLRFVLIAFVIALLILLVILIVQLTRVSAERNELSEQIAAAEETVERYEAQGDDLATIRREYNALRALYNALYEEHQICLAEPIDDDGVLLDPGTNRPILPATYTVQSGDYVRRIAHRFYDSIEPFYWRLIVDANPAVAARPGYGLHVGEILTIPALPDDYTGNQ